jgi:hypothetical protein
VKRNFSGLPDVFSGFAARRYCEIAGLASQGYS